MGIGVGLFLFAVGAIMRFAVTVHAHGFSVHTVGDILMIVGAIGVVLGIVFWTSLGFGSGRSTYVRDDVHVHDHTNSDIPRTF